MNKIALVGYAVGLGAGNPDCKLGPSKIFHSEYLNVLRDHIEWVETIKAEGKEDRLTLIAEACQNLAEIISPLLQQKRFFVTLGGDHTSAIGTWSGVHSNLNNGKLGLLWIDAHLDSHTPQTSPSHNPHGMPLAALLGYGDSRLINVGNHSPKLLPENVCVIGVRSFEAEEKELLDSLKVRIFTMDEIRKHGYESVFTQALEIVQRNTQYFGMSLDLDAIDPIEAPGVGSPVPFGLSAKALLQNIAKFAELPQFIGAEIVEFNPNLDIEQKTEKIIINILKLLVTNQH